MKFGLEQLNKLILSVLEAFGITTMILLLIFYLDRLAPFGNNSLANMDAKIQYLDFFAFLKDVLSGKASVEYTFSKTLGGTYIAVFSYYLSSPFNLLVAFFDKTELNTFFDILVILKIAVSSATCAVFLKLSFEKLKRLYVLLLSVSYALMQYNLAQSSNIMWLDGVYMLPVILLGVHNLVHKKSTALLAVSVGFSIIFNWYSAGINCMFSVVWCGFEILNKYEIDKDNVSCILKTIAHYCLTMLLGIGMSAFLFIPTIYALMEGKGSFNWDSLNPGFLGNILSVIQKYTISSLSESGSVSLYTGSFALVGCIAYFINPCKHKEKWKNGLLLAFTILAFYWRPLCFAFSLLKSVGSYWYRYSYVGSIVLIYISANFYSECEDAMTKEQEKCILKSAAYFAGSLLILDYVKPIFSVNLTYLTILSMLIITLMFVGLNRCHTWVWKRVLCLGVMLGLFGELGYNAHMLACHYMTRDVKKYKEYVADEDKLVKMLQQYDPDFYRISQTSTRNLKANALTANYNEASAFGYNSISSYTSAPENRQLEFLQRMGYRMNGAAMNIVNTSILPVDSLLGVKYILAEKPISGLERVEGIPEYNNKSVYYNPYRLPMAFKFNYTNIKETPTKINPFLYQNQLYSELIGEDVELFKQVDFETERLENGVRFRFRPEKAAIYYGNIVSKKELAAKLFVNDEFQTGYSQWLAPSVFYIPWMGEETIEIFLESDKNVETISDVQIYSLNLERFSQVIERLSERTVHEINIRNSEIFVEALGGEKESLFLSVPYHRQWKITNNKREVVPTLIGDCLMSIPLETGTNVIEMKYEIRGMKLGGCISIISWSILIFVFIRKKRKERDICSNE